MFASSSQGAPEIPLFQLMQTNIGRVSKTFLRNPSVKGGGGRGTPQIHFYSTKLNSAKGGSPNQKTQNPLNIIGVGTIKEDPMKSPERGPTQVCNVHLM